MITSNQLNPGMIIQVGRKFFRVESAVKVTVTKGAPFMKTKLKEMTTGKAQEKNFKLDQTIKRVTLIEQTLEFLYLEGKDYLFLDVNNLEQFLVSPDVVGGCAHYLKEGVNLKASFYGDTIFAIELPQFLEIMVANTEEEEQQTPVTNAVKIAVLETGAKVEVPLFIEVGDIIKVDTSTGEYIQRV